MAYSIELLNHIENPRNVGELPPPALTVEVVNSACGDRIRLSLQFDQHQITAARMRAYGCPPTLAAASALTELLIGRTVLEASQLETTELISALNGLPRGKLHAADLAIEALQTVLKNYRETEYEAGER
jgi:NifU-like protein involved in Fe-S cluster formation